MSVRESGEPRVRVRGATRFARQTPCRLHVPVFQRPPRCKRDFAGVIQCYILVRTSLAPLPSMSPPAPAPPSRRIHLLKGAGALEQRRKHASDVYRAVVKYLSFFLCGRLLSRGQPRCNYTIFVTSDVVVALRCLDQGLGCLSSSSLKGHLKPSIPSLVHIALIISNSPGHLRIQTPFWSSIPAQPRVNV